MSEFGIIGERTETMTIEETGSKPDHAPADLTAILVSRICHDLVSPVGAIVNGVDLVREIGGGDIEAELAMISQSSNRASALLQYYRIAFGAASDDSEISRNALHEQATAFISSPRIILDWPTDNGPHLPRSIAKILLQVLLCARGLSGMRGVIGVRIAQDAALPIEISIQSEGGPETPEMLDLLRGNDPDRGISPRLVEFMLTRYTADASGVDLGIVQEPGEIVITIS